MNYQTAIKIWNDIESSTSTELKTDLVAAAVRYARLRTDWWLASNEDRAQMENSRTFAHNRLIDAVNILCRNMRQAGEPSRWRGILGDERQTIGDWACYLHAHLGVKAR